MNFYMNSVNHYKLLSFNCSSPTFFVLLMPGASVSWGYIFSLDSSWQYQLHLDYAAVSNNVWNSELNSECIKRQQLILINVVLPNSDSFATSCPWKYQVLLTDFPAGKFGVRLLKNRWLGTSWSLRGWDTLKISKGFLLTCLRNPFTSSLFLQIWIICLQFI